MLNRESGRANELPTLRMVSSFQTLVWVQVDNRWLLSS